LASAERAPIKDNKGVIEHPMQAKQPPHTGLPPSVVGFMHFTPSILYRGILNYFVINLFLVLLLYYPTFLQFN
jgi:hypothetical protein